MTLITSLPSEIMIVILSYCTPAEHLGLIRTCKHMSQLPRPTNYTMESLIEIETWPEYDFAGQQSENQKAPLRDKDCFACRRCLMLRPAQSFSNLQMKGKRRKRSTSDTPEARMKRICIGCAMASGLYKRGLIFEYGGAKVGLYEEVLGGGIGLVCMCCGYFGRVVSRKQLTRKVCMTCEVDCMPKRDGLLSLARYGRE